MIFQPVPVTDGNSWRHEVKIVVHREILPIVESHLHLHGAIIRQQYPDRIIQSIYLDTPTREDLADAEEGIGKRYKIRIRWYGDECEFVNASLEMKRRDGNLGSKNRWQSNSPIPIKGIPVSCWLRQILAAFVSGAHAVVANRQPQAWIRYHRMYRMTSDEKVRVTIDQDLRSDLLSHRMIFDSRFLQRMDPVAIIEIKALDADYDHLVSLLQGLPGIVQRCSKYALAVQPGWWHLARHSGGS
jgi:SPX domain protein involved in polyphosphate accumulation